VLPLLPGHWCEVVHDPSYVQSAAQNKSEWIPKAVGQFPLLIEYWVQDRWPLQEIFDEQFPAFGLFLETH
jgi:hypothetical protein